MKDGRATRGNAIRLEASVGAWGAALWAARRVRAQAAVEATATRALADELAPTRVRRQAANALAESASAPALRSLTTAVGDGDREVRAVAAATLAAKQPGQAAAVVRGLGTRVDAATLAPLALTAWPLLAGELLGPPVTRAFAAAVSILGARTDELIAVANTKGHAGRLAAIRALGELGGDAANIALEAIHNHDAEADETKLAAWKALKRLLRKVKKDYGETDKRTQDDITAAAGGGGASSDDDGDNGDDERGDADDPETSFAGVVEADDDEAADEDEEDDDD